jgi:hypothetical protein
MKCRGYRCKGYSQGYLMSGNENEKIKQSLPKIGIYSLEGSLFEK